MTAFNISSNAVTANDFSLTPDMPLRVASFRKSLGKTTDTFRPKVYDGQSAAFICAFNTTDGNFLRYTVVGDTLTLTQGGGTAGSLSYVVAGTQQIVILYTYRKV